ncbi:hypothetical protein FDG2_2579 [Candidatus Protofrankia californiensis]|uniref:Uncharacterized protein n=1 Tax=Candidatus Protofrankia californiensis TaxID=1839754 RepID=A0A1C3NXT6_9ACTN|nr:hypothetical protein FDG2_2579 [Candidatus Protofrankia californiensis]
MQVLFWLYRQAVGENVARGTGPGDGLTTQPSGTGTEQEDLVAVLRAGDEAVFTALVERYSPTMLRTA